MKPPPPPPIPVSGEPPAGNASGAPVAQDVRPSGSNPASPEFQQMIEFVNELRSHLGLGEIGRLPEATGTLAQHQPLSLALTVSVIKHRDGGPFYALVYEKEKAEALTKMGCSAGWVGPRLAWSEPNTSTMWEYRLPAFLKEFA